MKTWLPCVQLLPLSAFLSSFASTTERRKFFKLITAGDFKMECRRAVATRVLKWIYELAYKNTSSVLQILMSWPFATGESVSTLGPVRVSGEDHSLS